MKSRKFQVLVLFIFGILKSKVILSDSSVLMKILHAVDVSKSDEHLFNVTLELLQNICVCMRKTLKLKEENLLFDGDSTADDYSNKEKVLEIYRKIYNNTCFNLRNELTDKLHTNNEGNENDGDRIANISFATNGISHVALREDGGKSDFKTNFKDILFKMLMENKDLRNFAIRKSNLYRRQKFLSNQIYQQNIIVVISLSPKLYRNNENSGQIRYEDVIEMVTANNSRVVIDIYNAIFTDTNHKNKRKANEVKSCNLHSLYTFLTEKQNNNQINVLKLLDKKDSLKIYVDVKANTSQDDYSNICCSKNTQRCEELPIRKHFGFKKNATGYQHNTMQNYKETVSKIKSLVKLYVEKLKINDTGTHYDNISYGTDAECIGTSKEMYDLDDKNLQKLDTILKKQDKTLIGFVSENNTSNVNKISTPLMLLKTNSAFTLLHLLPQELSSRTKMRNSESNDISTFDSLEKKWLRTKKPTKQQKKITKEMEPQIIFSSAEMRKLVTPEKVKKILRSPMENPKLITTKTLLLMSATTEIPFTDQAVNPTALNIHSTAIDTFQTLERNSLLDISTVKTASIFTTKRFTPAKDNNFLSNTTMRNIHTTAPLRKIHSSSNTNLQMSTNEVLFPNVSKTKQLTAIIDQLPIHKKNKSRQNISKNDLAPDNLNKPVILITESGVLPLKTNTSYIPQPRSTATLNIVSSLFVTELLSKVREIDKPSTPLADFLPGKLTSKMTTETSKHSSLELLKSILNEKRSSDTSLRYYPKKFSTAKILPTQFIVSKNDFETNKMQTPSVSFVRAGKHTTTNMQGIPLVFNETTQQHAMEFGKITAVPIEAKPIFTTTYKQPNQITAEAVRNLSQMQSLKTTISMLPETAMSSIYIDKRIQATSPAKEILVPLLKKIEINLNNSRIPLSTTMDIRSPKNEKIVFSTAKSTKVSFLQSVAEVLTISDSTTHAMTTDAVERTVYSPTTLKSSIQLSTMKTPIESSSLKMRTKPHRESFKLIASAKEKIQDVRTIMPKFNADIVTKQTSVKSLPIDIISKVLGLLNKPHQKVNNTLSLLTFREKETQPTTVATKMFKTLGHPVQIVTLTADVHNVSTGLLDTMTESTIQTSLSSTETKNPLKQITSTYKRSSVVEKPPTVTPTKFTDQIEKAMTTTLNSDFRTEFSILTLKPMNHTQKYVQNFTPSSILGKLNTSIANQVENILLVPTLRPVTSEMIVDVKKKYIQYCTDNSNSFTRTSISNRDKQKLTTLPPIVVLEKPANLKLDPIIPSVFDTADKNPTLMKTPTSMSMHITEKIKIITPNSYRKESTSSLTPKSRQIYYSRASDIIEKTQNTKTIREKSANNEPTNFTDITSRRMLNGMANIISLVPTNILKTHIIFKKPSNHSNTILKQISNLKFPDYTKHTWSKTIKAINTTDTVSSFLSNDLTHNKTNMISIDNGEKTSGLISSVTNKTLSVTSPNFKAETRTVPTATNVKAEFLNLLSNDSTENISNLKYNSFTEKTLSLSDYLLTNITTETSNTIDIIKQTLSILYPELINNNLKTMISTTTNANKSTLSTDSTGITRSLESINFIKEPSIAKLKTTKRKMLRLQAQNYTNQQKPSTVSNIYRTKITFPMFNSTRSTTVASTAADKLLNLITKTTTENASSFMSIVTTEKTQNIGTASDIAVKVYTSNHFMAKSRNIMPANITNITSNNNMTFSILQEKTSNISSPDLTDKMHEDSKTATISADIADKISILVSNNFNEKNRIRVTNVNEKTSNTTSNTITANISNITSLDWEDNMWNKTMATVITNKLISLMHNFTKNNQNLLSTNRIGTTVTTIFDIITEKSSILDLIKNYRSTVTITDNVTDKLSNSTSNEVTLALMPIIITENPLRFISIPETTYLTKKRFPDKKEKNRNLVPRTMKVLSSKNIDYTGKTLIPLRTDVVDEIEYLTSDNFSTKPHRWTSTSIAVTRLSMVSNDGKEKSLNSTNSTNKIKLNKALNAMNHKINKNISTSLKNPIEVTTDSQSGTKKNDMEMSTIPERLLEALSKQARKSKTKKTFTDLFFSNTINYTSETPPNSISGTKKNTTSSKMLGSSTNITERSLKRVTFKNNGVISKPIQSSTDVILTVPLGTSAASYRKPLLFSVNYINHHITENRNSRGFMDKLSSTTEITPTNTPQNTMSTFTIIATPAKKILAGSNTNYVKESLLNSTVNLSTKKYINAIPKAFAKKLLKSRTGRPSLMTKYPYSTMTYGKISKSSNRLIHKPSNSKPYLKEVINSTAIRTQKTTVLSTSNRSKNGNLIATDASNEHFTKSPVNLHTVTTPRLKNKFSGQEQNNTIEASLNSTETNNSINSSSEHKRVMLPQSSIIQLPKPSTDKKFSLVTRNLPNTTTKAWIHHEIVTFSNLVAAHATESLSSKSRNMYKISNITNTWNMHRKRNHTTEIRPVSFASIYTENPTNSIHSHLIKDSDNSEKNQNYIDNSITKNDKNATEYFATDKSLIPKILRPSKTLLGTTKTNSHNEYILDSIVARTAKNNLTTTPITAINKKITIKRKTENILHPSTTNKKMQVPVAIETRTMNNNILLLNTTLVDYTPIQSSTVNALIVNGIKKSSTGTTDYMVNFTSTHSAFDSSNSIPAGRNENIQSLTTNSQKAIYSKSTTTSNITIILNLLESEIKRVSPSIATGYIKRVSPSIATGYIKRVSPSIATGYIKRVSPSIATGYIKRVSPSIATGYIKRVSPSIATGYIKRVSPSIATGYIKRVSPSIATGYIKRVSPSIATGYIKRVSPSIATGYIKRVSPSIATGYIKRVSPSIATGYIKRVSPSIATGYIKRVSPSIATGYIKRVSPSIATGYIKRVSPSIATGYIKRVSPSIATGYIKRVSPSIATGYIKRVSPSIATGYIKRVSPSIATGYIKRVSPSIATGYIKRVSPSIATGYIKRVSPSIATGYIKRVSPSIATGYIKRVSPSIATGYIKRVSPSIATGYIKRVSPSIATGYIKRVSPSIATGYIKRVSPSIATGYIKRVSPSIATGYIKRVSPSIATGYIKRVSPSIATGYIKRVSPSIATGYIKRVSPSIATGYIKRVSPSIATGYIKRVSPSIATGYIKRVSPSIATGYIKRVSPSIATGYITENILNHTADSIPNPTISMAYTTSISSSPTTRPKGNVLISSTTRDTNVNLTPTATHFRSSNIQEIKHSQYFSPNSTSFLKNKISIVELANSDMKITSMITDNIISDSHAIDSKNSLVNYVPNLRDKTYQIKKTNYYKSSASEMPSKIVTVKYAEKTKRQTESPVLKTESFFKTYKPVVLGGPKIKISKNKVEKIEAIPFTSDLTGNINNSDVIPITKSLFTSDYTFSIEKTSANNVHVTKSTINFKDIPFTEDLVKITNWNSVSRKKVIAVRPSENYRLKKLDSDKSSQTNRSLTINETLKADTKITYPHVYRAANTEKYSTKTGTKMDNTILFIKDNNNTKLEKDPTTRQFVRNRDETTTFLNIKYKSDEDENLQTKFEDQVLEKTKNINQSDVNKIDTNSNIRQINIFHDGYKIYGAVYGDDKHRTNSRSTPSLDIESLTMINKVNIPRILANTKTSTFFKKEVTYNKPKLPRLLNSLNIINEINRNNHLNRNKINYNDYLAEIATKQISAMPITKRPNDLNVTTKTDKFKKSKLQWLKYTNSPSEMKSISINNQIDITSKTTSKIKEKVHKVFKRRTLPPNREKTVKYNTYQPTDFEELDISIFNKFGRFNPRLIINNMHYPKKILKVTTPISNKQFSTNSTRALITTERSTSRPTITSPIIQSLNTTRIQNNFESNHKFKYKSGRIVTKKYRMVKSSDTQHSLPKTVMYPVKVMPPKRERKVMKPSELSANLESEFSPKKYFVSNQIDKPKTRSHWTPQRINKPSVIPKQVVLRPKFDTYVEPNYYFPRTPYFRPKPLVIDNPNDIDFYKANLKNILNPKGLTVQEKAKFLQEILHKSIEEQESAVQKPPTYIVPPKKDEPKFLRDRVDSIRNFIGVYLKPSTLSYWKEDFLQSDDYDTEEQLVLEPTVFHYYKKYFPETTTQKTTTKRRRRTIFFLSPTVTDWWLDDMYLKVRLPLPINSNPGMVFPRRHFAKMEEVADLGALFIDDLLDYKEMLDRGELPLERATSREKGQPLCMEQFYRLLGVCRIPEVGRDRLEFPPIRGNADEGEELVVAACRNYFYPIPVKAADRGRLTSGEIQAQLLHCMVDAAGAPPAPRVGLLTSMNRDQWARARETLIKDENNRTNFELISRSLCILCLDEAGGDRADTDAATNAMLRAMHGAGTNHHSANRWFDKTVQLIISQDGTVGMCYEHSAAEGVAVVRLAERALARAEVSDRPAPPPALLPAPQAMRWTVAPDVHRAIDQAARDLDRAISDLDHKVYTYRGYGREFMKSCRTSPDVYIQLALQYAYYKMYGYLVTTYESASLRRFRNGRVDNIRSAHAAAHAWAASMCTAETPPLNEAVDDGQKKVSFNLYGDHKKLELFEEAARKQTEIMVSNILGRGIDNHLLGLRAAARETLGELPPVFTDATYQQMIEFKLSTSQVATTTDATFMGYGAVVPDGYGCSYNPKRDHVIFCISSFTSSSVTNTEAFRQSLEEALNSMQLMFQAKKPDA